MRDYFRWHATKRSRPIRETFSYNRICAYNHIGSNGDFAK